MSHLPRRYQFSRTDWNLFILPLLWHSLTFPRVDIYHVPSLSAVVLAIVFNCLGHSKKCADDDDNDADDGDMWPGAVPTDDTQHEVVLTWRTPPAHSTDSLDQTSCCLWRWQEAPSTLSSVNHLQQFLPDHWLPWVKKGTTNHAHNFTRYLSLFQILSLRGTAIHSE